MDQWPYKKRLGHIEKYQGCIFTEERPYEEKGTRK